jgi:hypothetical protein
MMGATTASGAAGSTPTTIPTFSQGLQLWSNPSSALTATQTLLSNAGTAFTGQLLPFTAGVLLPPVAVIGLLIYVMSQGGRR